VWPYPLRQTHLVPLVDPARVMFTDVAAELLPGAFAITGGQDHSGAAIVEYRPRMHAKKHETPKDMLRVVLYLMETTAAASPAANRNGITLIVCVSKKNGLFCFCF
jgi:hypothetical protein